jgi:HPt (histidine-containing phosphotransfer) domain-containing protein
MSNTINLNYLKEISGGDNAFIKEMLELYMATTAKEAELFKGFYEKEDLLAIGHLAHKMKAPVQMLGFTSLYNTLREIEDICKTGVNLNLLPVNIENVIRMAEESVVEVKLLLEV